MNKRSMKKSKEDEHSQLTKIVDNFEEIVRSDDFTQQAKNNPELQEKMQSLTAMLKEWSKACGITEYTPIDSGYTGDEVLEKYRNNVGRSWGNKTERKNAVPKITTEEITASHSSYMARKRALEDKREKDRIAIGYEPRKLVTDEITGQKIYMSTKENKSRELEYASSENEDDDIIDNILKKESKNRSTDKVGHLTYDPRSHIKETKIPKKRRKKVIVYETPSSSSCSESEEEIQTPPLRRRGNRKTQLSGSRHISNRERIKEYGNSVSLRGLDDVHQFHMNVLDGSSDDE